jgi:hypothetical protein
VTGDPFYGRKEALLVLFVMLNPLSCGILSYELFLWTMFVMHRELLLLQKGFAFHDGIVYHCNMPFPIFYFLVLFMGMP